MQDYVVQRRVPLKRLLLAFGIVMVRVYPRRVAKIRLTRGRKTPETAAMDDLVHLRLLKAALTRMYAVSLIHGLSVTDPDASD